MLSFDISDRQVNIVMGDNSANKIRIQKSLSVSIPEDMIINGEVVNLSGLGDLLLTNLKAELMKDKEAIVTFSSSNIVFKELVVPNAKGNEFLTMVQNYMAKEMGITDEYSISYTVVGPAGEENPGSVKVLATACPSLIVEAYRKLFNIMGINLRSVNISCNSISRIVLADKGNKEKMPLLVCQIDDNFLGLTLFENGQMAFARYVPISPDDYDSEDYIIEALNENIFRMEQFNKARGGSGLQNVLLYGKIDDFIKLVDSLDGLDVQASILGVPAQITGFENFEFTVYANAIAALYKRNKATERINLLEVDQSTGKSGGGSNALILTGLAIAAASVVGVVAIAGILNLRKSGIDKEIKSANKTIEDCDEVIEQNKKLHDELLIIDTYNALVKCAADNLDSQPVLNKQVFEQIDSAIKSGNAKSYKGFAYNLNTGMVTITEVELEKQLDAPTFVREVKKLNIFRDVVFTGYSGTGEVEDPVIINTLDIYMKGPGEE